MRKNLKKILTLSILIVVVVVIILLCLRSCGSNTPDPGETTEPVAATADTNLKGTDPPLDTTQPTAETTAPTEPEETVSPATEASATEPSATEPPATEAPKATEPPVTEASTTESPKVEHTHNFSSKTKEATCTADGYATYTCSCGYSYTEVIRATGHNWSEWSVTTQPTAEAEGIESRKCGVCGTAETRSIAKLPAESNPPATEPPTTETSKQEPAETNPPATEPPATESPSTEPAGCTHAWEMIYHPEVGHYSDYFYECACGARFESPEACFVHMESFPNLDMILYHGSWQSRRDYIVDSPEYTEWICSKCGVSTTTQP